MAESKIQVDLVADLKLAINKLGLGSDIQKAMQTQPGLVKAIAGGLGLDIQRVMADSTAKGVQQGLARVKAPPVIPGAASGGTALQRFIQSLGGGGLPSKFLQYQIGRSALEAAGIGSGVARLGGAALAAGGGASLGPAGLAVAAAFVALKEVAEKLASAFKFLLQHAEAGARLYEQSRAIGRSTGQTSAYLKTLGAVGIDEGSAMRLAAYGEFGRGRGWGGRGGMQSASQGMMIAAMRAGDMQLMQQIYNMREEIDKASREMQVAAGAAANIAKQNFDTILQWRIFQQEFKTFWQQVSGLFGGVVETVLRLANAWGEMVNFVVELQVKILQLFRTIAEYAAIVMQPINAGLANAFRIAAALLPHSSGRDPMRIVGGQRETHFSALERMGLVIGGGAHNELRQANVFLRQIVANTAGLNRTGNGRPMTPEAHAAAQVGAAFASIWTGSILGNNP